MFARVTYVQAPQGEGKIQEGLKPGTRTCSPSTARGRASRRALARGSQHREGASVPLGGRRGADREHRGRGHKQALERSREFFEGVHDPENYEVNLYLGPIYNTDEGGPGLEIFRQTQAEA